MSKSKKVGHELSWAYMYWPYAGEQLEGRLLTFVETLGFNESREKAVKDVVRNAIYEFFNSAIYLPAEEAQEVLKNHEKNIQRYAKEYHELVSDSKTN